MKHKQNPSCILNRRTFKRISFWTPFINYVTVKNIATVAAQVRHKNIIDWKSKTLESINYLMGTYKRLYSHLI
jgi:hypothetical protein